MLKDCRIGLFLGALLFALAGCADKKDGSASCMNQLNAEQYQSVAENTNCSNYERASGYLGLAGMSFSNFMKKGASDNLTKTLTISKLDNASDYSTGTRNYITKALCLVGPDNLTSSSRCTGLTASGSRGLPEREISFFGLLGDMIYVNYGVLDNDSNGTITKTETDNFTSLNTSGVNSGSNDTTIKSSSPNYEIITNSTRLIYNDNLSYCYSYQDNYTTTPTSSTDPVTSNNCSSFILPTSKISEIRPIFKLDNMTDITGGADLTPVTTLVSEITSISTSLNNELSNIGLSDNSSLRTSLTEGLSKIDNGGFKSDGTTVCGPAVALDVFYLLVKDAADNSTSSTPSNLHTKNLIGLNDLKNSVNSSVDITNSTGISGITYNYARLIYAKNLAGTTYSDSYESAHTALYNAIKNTRSLGTETSTKGDGKVILKEILCIGDN